MSESVQSACYESPKQSNTAQIKTFSIMDIFSKCDQIRSFLPIWSHLLKKSLKENFIFCAVMLRNKRIGASSFVPGGILFRVWRRKG